MWQRWIEDLKETSWEFSLNRYSRYRSRVIRGRALVAMAKERNLFANAYASMAYRCARLERRNMALNDHIKDMTLY